MNPSSSMQQFNEIVAIIGLPRSGTTLATSVFDAHPFCVACYEPWNRVKGTDLSPEQTPEDLVAKFALNAAPDANIFVLKETSIEPKAIQWLTKFLQHNTKSHRVQVVWSLRNYRHSYLSFVEGAREWWGYPDIETGAESYSQWVERASHGTIILLRLYEKYPGAIYAYESLAEDAPTVLPRLMEALGLDFYTQQVNYLEHYSPKQVRGDISMSKNPRPISNESMKQRETEWSKHQQELAGSDVDALRQQLDAFWQSIQEQVVFAGQVPTNLIPDRLRSLMLHPGHEYREVFSSKVEWEEFNRENSAITDRGIIKHFASSIMYTGVEFMDKTVKANELEIVHGDYRNSFVNEGLASRSRALLVEFLFEFIGGKISPDEIRILTPEARTGLVSFLADRFPKLQTSKHLHSPKQRKESATREHQDLAALACKDASFDYFVVDDVFHIIPNLDNVLREAHRVLAPGGVLLATFPLAIENEEHVVNATRSTDGGISCLAPQKGQEGHTDTQPAVAFQIPGWNVLGDCRKAGFARAEFVFLCSPSKGILASDVSGIMILRAEKPSGSSGKIVGKIITFATWMRQKLG